MGAEKTSMICAIFCIAILEIPLAITCIVLSTKEGTCDIDDAMGLNVSDYLLGLGIANLTISICLICGLLAFLTDCLGSMISILILSVLQTLFSFAWFIIGAIILFRSNIPCINVGATYVIFALVMWCFSAITILRSCCGGRNNNSNV